MLVGFWLLVIVMCAEFCTWVNSSFICKLVRSSGRDWPVVFACISGEGFLGHRAFQPLICSRLMFACGLLFHEFFLVVFGSFLFLAKVSHWVPEEVMSRSVFGQLRFESTLFTPS